MGLYVVILINISQFVCVLAQYHSPDLLDPLFYKVPQIYLDPTKNIELFSG